MMPFHAAFAEMTAEIDGKKIKKKANRKRRVMTWPCGLCRLERQAGGPGGSCQLCRERISRGEGPRSITFCHNCHRLLRLGTTCPDCGPNPEADAFTIENRFPRTPAAHEVLTREAATGLPGLTPTDIATLIAGNRRVDNENLVNHVLPDQQRRHVLRRSLCQTTVSALDDARRTLHTLHLQALQAFRSGNRTAALGWAGEACHLIQDSYSAAHVERDFSAPGAPIRYIRYFGMLGDPAPREHAFPPRFDDRDFIDRGGMRRPEARAATLRTRLYLQLLLSHAAAHVSPSAVRLGMIRFLNGFLRLSPAVVNPRTVYFRCRFA
jgi:hypothetical protein